MKKIIFGVGAVAPAMLLLATKAFAAADADIVAAGTALATSTKENVIGLTTGNIGYVAIVFALVLGIAFVMRLFKRASR